ncbi:TBC1 domain family member 15-like isoform X2 [Ornithodoros turicata]|uniref:TBC1 domain family member 15-like isoform X2 n=1 Tax=Ornithodoros turicata TaxID=34597 RepID=UPI003139536E
MAEAELPEHHGDVQYTQDNVSVHVSGPHKVSTANGKLDMTKNRFGIKVSWTPTKLHLKQDSLSGDDCNTWEELSPDAPVAYRVLKEPKRDSLDAVQIKQEQNAVQPFSFEIDELASYQCKQKADKHEVTLFLSDGTRLPTLTFIQDRQKHFIRELQEFLKFKTSRKDSSLHVVVNPERPDREALEKSFEELNLFPESRNKGIVSRFFNDPYTATMDGFAKVTNLVTGSGPYTMSPHRYHSFDEMMELQPESFTGLEIANHEEEPGFEVVVRILPNRPDVERCCPLSHEEWVLYYDSEGRICNEASLRERIFRGGIHPHLRKEVWTFLLDYFSFNSTYKEREARRKQLKDDYFRMKLQWKTISEDQELRFSGFRERKSIVEKDVSRTDRTHEFYEGENNKNVEMLYDILMTYCMYNFDLGYVQGMSDLLSPILIVMENEADAFWCFVGFIKRVESNFDMDQMGMKTQLLQLHDVLGVALPKLATYLDQHDSGNLYFCFRWLIILFKREFKFEDIMKLWEVLWTDLPCKNFHLLICAAILDTETTRMMENNYGLNEILKHVNDMSYKINLEETLARAEGIYLQLKDCLKLPESVQETLGICRGSADVSCGDTTKEKDFSEPSATAAQPKDSPLSSSSVEVLSEADIEARSHEGQKRK